MLPFCVHQSVLDVQLLWASCSLDHIHDSPSQSRTVPRRRRWPIAWLYFMHFVRRHYCYYRYWWFPIVGIYFAFMFRAGFRCIYHSLYIVPGSSAPLKRICLGGHNLLLIYDDKRARLWDTKTKQLWRSMGLEKAEELITQGRWTDLYVVHPIDFAFLKLLSLRLWSILEGGTCLPETFWALAADSNQGPDAGTIISFLFFSFVQNLRISY